MEVAGVGGEMRGKREVGGATGATGGPPGATNVLCVDFIDVGIWAVILWFYRM